MEEAAGKRPLPPPQSPVHTKKPRSEAKRKADKRRSKTRINIGSAFHRWRLLLESKQMKFDAELATFLLDRYEGPQSSTPMKKGVLPSDIAVSSIGSSDSDRDRQPPEKVTKGTVDAPELTRLECSLSEMSIGEEEPNVDECVLNDWRNSTIDWAGDAPPESPLEMEEGEEEDSDEDYIPPISIRLGGALPQIPRIDNLPVIGLDETVHDLGEDEEHEPLPEPDDHSGTDHPSAPKVLEAEDIVGAKASIVYEQCLLYLASFAVLPFKECNMKLQSGAICHRRPPFRVNIKSRASASILEWVCADGHIVWRWFSQPAMTYGMLAGDFMLSTNILLSGNNYNKIAFLFKLMNMGIVGHTTHFTIQDTYCIDSIKRYWLGKRAQSIERLQNKDVVILADGRMDTPGHCAQYCTYTTMENEGKEIINVVTVDKRQTERRSGMMEKHAFILTVDQLLKEVNLVEICTDAHAQISALLDPVKGKYKDTGIHHSLDMWHGAKNLAKKITEAAKVKDQTVLLLWLKDIVSHFWWCCKTADTYEDFLALWVGLIHHVCNEHEWAMGGCRHGPLVDTNKTWIERDSKAHKALVEIILKKRWLKDVHKFLRFRSTAELESFQNHILMYASKRQAFTPSVYESRVLLAALDYNFHCTRPKRKRADGTGMYKRLYKKHAKHYGVYALRTPKTYSYIGELQATIVSCRLESGRGMPRRRTLRPEDPRRLGVLAPVPPPPTAELVQKQVKRGLGPEFQSSPPH